MRVPARPARASAREAADVISASWPVRRANAAAATGNGDRPGADQRLDRPELDDLERLGRGDDASPPSAGVVRDRPAALGLERADLLFAIEGPNRLGRPPKGRIVLVDLHVGQD